MKIVSKDACKELLIKAFAYFPSAINRAGQTLYLEHLTQSDFDALAMYIDETIGVSATGKSLKSLLNGAGSKNSTINIVCAFLLVKKGFLAEKEMQFEKHISDNRYYVRRYFENTQPEERPENTLVTNTDISLTNVVVDPPIQQKPAYKPDSKLYIYGFAGLFVLLVVFGIYTATKEEVIFPEFQVSIPDNSDRYPKEVKITYDLKSDKYLNNARINFMTTPILLNKLKGTISLTALKPNLYYIGLYSNKGTYDLQRILLASDGWRGYIGGTLLLPEDYMADGAFHLKKLNNSQRALDGDYYTIFSTFRNFNINGDNFELEADVKNPPDEGSPWAHDVSVDIIGFENPITFNFLSPDALKHANMVVGDSDFKVGEKQKVLQKLGILFPEWRRLKVTCKNRRIKIMLDEQLILDEHYDGEIGQVVGVQFLFKGSGYLKNVTLNGRKVN